MPTITRLVAGKRDPSRISIYIDGKFACSLSAEEVISRGLVRGYELSENDQATLLDKSTKEKLLSKILNFISYRPRSQKEIRDRLKKYKATSEQIEDIVNKITKLGVLNEQEFAKYLVESRRAQGRSSRHIKSELKSQGIDKEVSEDSLVNGSNDRATVRELIKRKSHLEKEKLIAYLARRGFPWELVREALSEYNEPY